MKNFISRALCGTYATTFTAILLYFSGASSFAAIPMLFTAVLSDMHVHVVRPDWAHERLKSQVWKRMANPWFPMTLNVIFFSISIITAIIYSWKGSFCFEALDDVVRIFFSTPHASLLKYGGLCGAPFGFISYIVMLWLILLTFFSVLHSRLIFHGDFAQADARTRILDFKPKEEIINPRGLVFCLMAYFGVIQLLIVSRFPDDNSGRYSFFQPPIYITGYTHWIFISSLSILFVVIFGKASGTLNRHDKNDIHRQ